MPDVMQELTIFAPALPEIVIALGAVALLLVGAFRGADAGRPSGWRR